MQLRLAAKTAYSVVVISLYEMYTIDFIAHVFWLLPAAPIWAQLRADASSFTQLRTL